MKKSKKVLVLAMASLMLGTISPIVSLASVGNAETILEGKRIIESGVDENGIEYTVYEGSTSDKSSPNLRIVDTRYIVRYVTYHFRTHEQAVYFAEGGTKSINWKETIDGAVYKGTLKSTGEYTVVGGDVTLIFTGNVIGNI